MKSMAKVKKKQSGSGSFPDLVCSILYGGSSGSGAGDAERENREDLLKRQKLGSLEFDKDKLSVRQTNGNRLIVKAKALGQANLTFRSGGRQYRYTIWDYCKAKVFRAEGERCLCG